MKDQGTSTGGRPGASDAVWEAVRADYLAGASGLECAHKHGVGVTALRSRAAAEGWRRKDQPWSGPPNRLDAEDEGVVLEDQIEGDLDRLDVLGTLSVGGFVLLLAIVANIFLQMPVLSLAISGGIVMISAAWMLYDVQRIVRGGETNYVSASLSVYLNLYNMFVSLLHLLMALTGQRD